MSKTAWTWTETGRWTREFRDCVAVLQAWPLDRDYAGPFELTITSPKDQISVFVAATDVSAGKRNATAVLHAVAAAWTATQVRP